MHLPNAMVEIETKTCIVIPFHHRADLLIPLLKHLGGFSVLVVDDGPEQSDWTVWHDIHHSLHCVRSTGNSGFTNAANLGLNTAEQLGFSYVLLMNDDAWLDTVDIHKIFDMAHPNKLVSPIVECNNRRYYGVRIHSWGLIKLNTKPSKQIDALLGACLLMPSPLRFDNRFHHGFEDLHLTSVSKQSGFELVLREDITCRHIGGGTVHPQSVDGIRFSVYGHLALYDSLRRMPLVYTLYLVNAILKPRSVSKRIQTIGAVHQGVFDWLWSAIAARIASSKAGSNRIR